MQEVNIYIDVYHTGHFSKGTGTYNILLELISKNGEPKTKEFYEGLKQTTKNRTAIKACIVAMDHMIRDCNVKIITNSRFVVQVINQNWNKDKNSDLWQQLLERIAKYNATFTYEPTNPYSTYMFMMAKKAQIIYTEDTGNIQ